MNKICIALLCSALTFTVTAAEAQTPMRIRGTIESVDGNVVRVKTREGREVKIAVDAKTTYSYPKLVKLADIKPGTPMGTTTVPGPDGKLIAREVHVFPAGQPVPNEGHRSWDLETNSNMTNAAVSAVAATAGNGRELTLTYKGGTQTVIVSENTPVVSAVASDRSLLKSGEYAYIQAAMNNDGDLVASRFQVSKDGVRPPQ